MNKEKIKEVANKLMFAPSEEDIQILEKLYDEVDRNIQILKSIDVNNIKPMLYIDSTPIDFLREDIAKNTLSKAQALKNAQLANDDYILITKEVEHD